jgi:hypothetical protein
MARVEHWWFAVDSLRMPQHGSYVIMENYQSMTAALRYADELGTSLAGLIISRNAMFTLCCVLVRVGFQRSNYHLHAVDLWRIC